MGRKSDSGSRGKGSEMTDGDRTEEKRKIRNMRNEKTSLGKTPRERREKKE